MLFIRKMFLVGSLLGAVFLYRFFLHGGEQLVGSHGQFATHALLIFLDSQEEMGQGPFSGQLLRALQQKTLPILVSTSLFSSIVKAPSVFEDKTVKNRAYFTEMVKQFGSLQRKLTELIGTKELLSVSEQQNVVLTVNQYFTSYPIANDLEDFLFMQKILVRLVIRDAFNPEDWLIKVVDQEKSFLLFIPVSYAKKLADPQKMPPALEYQESQSFSAFEYKLGLKVDHMETISVDRQGLLGLRDIIQKVVGGKQEGSERTHLDKDFIKAVWTSDQEKEEEIDGKKYMTNSSALFLSRADYTLANYSSPQWAIYMGGHGALWESICELSIPTFKKFLDFLATKIDTKLFAYFSCYAVGTNIDLVYEDFEKQTSKTYPFIIMTSGTTDRSLLVDSLFIELSDLSLRSIDFEKKKLAVQSNFNVSDFAKQILTTQEIDLKKVATSILSVGNRDLYNKVVKLGSTVFILNLPSSIVFPRTSIVFPYIRLPGAEWFNLEAIDNTVTSLGRVFARTCSKKVFKEKKQTYYLLYVPIIPCELELSQDFWRTKSLFIPMVNKTEAVVPLYYIKKIIAPTATLGRIVSSVLTGIPEDQNFQLVCGEIVSEDSGKDPLLDVAIDIRSGFKDGLKLNLMGASGQIYFRRGDTFYEYQGTKSGSWLVAEVEDYRPKFSQLFNRVDEFEKKERIPLEKLSKILQKIRQEKLRGGTSKEIEKGG